MIEDSDQIGASASAVKTPTIEIEVTEHLKAKFWPRVKQGAPDDCWPWTGGSSDGYGVVTIKKKQLSAHRVSFAINHGPIPDGLWVLHKCDNPICVNPDHLFAGTNRDNVDDMLSKGRQANGERQHLAKLTDQKVYEIRNRWANRLTQQKLADEYGISVFALNLALYHTNWKHLGSITDHKKIGARETPEFF